MTPVEVVQLQVDAYNDRDLDRFIAAYREDIIVYRLPASAPAIVGRAAFNEFYATTRFNRPGLHAQIVNRIVLGNKVIDHERISGVRAEPFDIVVIYEVVGDLIARVWSLAPE